MKEKRFDPVASFPRLEKLITSGKLPSLLVFCAPGKGSRESFFAEEAARLFSERCRKEKANVFVHDGSSEEFNLRSLCSDLLSPSLFAEGKPILIRHPDAHCRRLKKDGNKRTPLEEALVDLLSAEKSITTAICLFDQLTPRSPILQELEQAGAWVFECRKLYASPPPWARGSGETEVHRWIAQRAREASVSLTRPQIHILAKRCGDDLAMIEGELEKIRLAGSFPEEDEAPPESGHLWTFLQEFFQRRTARCLEMIHAMREVGLPDWSGKKTSQPAAIYAMWNAVMAKEARRLMQVHRLVAAGLPQDQALSEAGVTGPASGSTRERLRSWNRQDLGGLLQSLLTLERDFKTGRCDDVLLHMERLVLAHTRRGELIG